MSTEPGTGTAMTSEWEGGRSPYAASNLKLGMWLFIVGDAFTFGALLVSCGYLRLASVDWPKPFGMSTILMATLMTFFLLSSSVTMALAVAKARKGEISPALKLIGLTMLGGLLFIVLHAKEWWNLIHEGARLFANPWGAPLFTATFFTVTGMHMAHVLSGLIVLAIVARGLSKGRFSADHVEVSGLYWHFVDLVWMFVFPVIYLLSMKIS